MFLSKLKLMPGFNATKVMQGLRKNGVYASHQLIWNLFTSDNQRSFIFREESLANGEPSYYILSKSVPTDAENNFLIQTKEFSPRLYVGQKLGFSIRLNATIDKKDDQGKRKRHDVMMDAKIKAKVDGIIDKHDIARIMESSAKQWLTDKDRTQRWGMKVESLATIDAYDQHDVSKKDQKSVRFSSFDTQGVLTVVDPDTFLHQLYQGFGRSKAFGCGLMLIRPV